MKNQNNSNSHNKKPVAAVKVNRKQPVMYEVEIERADGSKVIVKSTQNKNIVCQINFDKHAAYLPRKEVAKLIITSNVTEGLL